MKAIVLALGLILVSVSGFAQSDGEPEGVACQEATVFPATYRVCLEKSKNSALNSGKVLACGTATTMANSFLLCLDQVIETKISVEQISTCGLYTEYHRNFKACLKGIVHPNVPKEDVISCSEESSESIAHPLESRSTFERCLDESKKEGVNFQKIDICGKDTTAAQSFIECLEISPYLSTDQLGTCGETNNGTTEYRICLKSYSGTSSPHSGAEQ